MKRVRVIGRVIAAMSTPLSLAVLLATGPADAAGAPDWDRAANIKAVAAQIGEIQARGGVEQAFKFISACYKTHGLASKYSKAFEGCIAQDFIVSQALARVYERVPPDTLRKAGAPSPEQIEQSFRNRAAAAFSQYQRTPQDADALRELVDRHGMPVFLAIIFPKSGKSSDNPEAK